MIFFSYEFASLLSQLLLMASFAFVISLCVLFAVDDFFIDLVAWICRLGPTRLSESEVERIKLLPESRFAIMIANWKEDDVIERMVVGNIRGINYSNYTLCLGVYPNDPETTAIALALEKRFPNVKAIVNSKDGPTSKGQLLNEMARQILSKEESWGWRHDYFLMQDSEDILHPLHLKVINAYRERADFIQTPVFSFNVAAKDLVGGTYIDEFAEVHTKELFVREKLGAPVPSAGVGTCMSRRLVLAFMAAQGGELLREDTLTEDYVLGLSTQAHGFKSTFLCFYQVVGRKIEFIATREFFPKNFLRSIRQKTRWSLGIVFQGSDILGWQGSIASRYFLYRDRRGPINSVVVLLGTVLTVNFWLFKLLDLPLPYNFSHPVVEWASLLISGSFCLRIFRRMQAVRMTNGWNQVCLVPFRWAVANVVNFSASVRAYREYKDFKKTGVRPKWVKTQHELPADFGQEAGVQSI